MKAARFCSEVEVVIASVHEDGMHVEVYADGPGNNIQSVLVAFRSEREGQIRALFNVAGEVIEIPLEELEKAVEAARKEVHSEPHYLPPGE